MDLFHSPDRQDAHIFYVNPLLTIFLQGQFLRALLKQISDFVVVDLNKGAAHEKLFVLIRRIINKPVDVLDAVEDNSLVVSAAEHRVGLAAAGLAVSEDGPVVAFNYSFNQGERCFVVDLSLLALWTVHRIKSKHLFILALN